MNKAERDAVIKEIDSHIDWDYIAGKKQDAEDYLKFVERGQHMLDLVRNLKSIKDSGIGG